MRALSVLAVALAVVGCNSSLADQSAQMPDLDLEGAAATITPEDLLERLSVIADDSMMGRNTPSPQLDQVAEWIGDQFASFGILPGNGDSYLQAWPYPLVGADWESSSIEVTGGGTLVFGADVAYTGASRANGDFTGPLVVVAGSEGDATSLDVAGKHVVFLTETAADAGGRGGGRSGRRSVGVGIPGAVDPLVVFRISETSDADWDASVEQRRAAGTRVYGDAPFTGSPPALELRRSSLGAILSDEVVGLALSLRSGPYRLIEVPGVELTVHARSRIVSDDTAPNVVGIISGSDPDLRDEYVVISAHIDHVGVNGARARPDSIRDAGGALLRVEMDSIFNGADDDGSGTILMVQLAKAFASLETPPARSLVFLGVSGEEKGLLGSRWYAQHPTVPIEDVVADLNIDMVGRNWSDTIVVIGKEHSDLGATLNAVGEVHPELNMAPIDDIWPEQNFYGRSDHANFARQGVPILFFFNGTHEDYHQVSDEVDKVDFDKMSRIGKLVFYVGYEVGNSAGRPQWSPDSYVEIVPDSIRAARSR